MKYISAKTAKRISALADERGITHWLDYEPHPGNGVKAINLVHSPETGGIVEQTLTAESLLSELWWLDEEVRR